MANHAIHIQNLPRDTHIPAQLIMLNQPLYNKMPPYNLIVSTVTIISPFVLPKEDTPTRRVENPPVKQQTPI
jgi:hypothetical protein